MTAIPAPPVATPTTPASTVTTQTYADAPVVGTGTGYAREDHKHGFPAHNAPNASAPAVGPPGDTYYNTTAKKLFISDGTAWYGVMPEAEVETAGWIPASFGWLVARNNEILIRDFAAGFGGFTVGTRINATHNSNPFYGVVTSAASGAPTILANPLNPVSYNTTSNIFTRSNHGLVNGNVIYFTGGSAGGATVPGAVLANLPYYVINTAGAPPNTFQISATPGGTPIVVTGSNGTTEIATGTYLQLAANADYGLTRAVAMVNARYSYALCPPGWPGWFNYTTGQAINPLTFTLGYSVIPTSLVYNFRVDGNMCIFNLRDGANGTSNATTLSVSLPVTASAAPAGAIWTGVCAGVDNGTAFNNPGGLQIGAGATVCQCWRDMGNISPWTASLGKRVIRGQIIYGV